MELSGGLLWRPLFNEVLLLHTGAGLLFTGPGLSELTPPELAGRRLLPSASAELVASY